MQERAMTARPKSVWKAHLAVYGRAYLAGACVAFTGAIAGGAGAMAAGGALYRSAAESALASLLTGGAAQGFLRALWVALCFYVLVAAGGAHWAVAPFSVLFMALWGVPVGCACALLWQQGTQGALCAVLCAALGALVKLPAMLRAWVVMLKGAHSSLKKLPRPPCLQEALAGALLLLPACLLQVYVLPALFRTAAAWF